MLEQVDLSLRLSKRAFKLISHFQIERIYKLTHLNYENRIPVIILFEGWDAAGKGTAIRALTERLDPRGFKVLPTQAPRTFEQQKPWLWRFWMQIPRHGQIAIFDRSWYGRVLIERVNGLTPIPDWIRAYEEINAFERTLADDDTVFVKFWLHISREEQLQRYVTLTQDPDTAWQVTAEDWENHRRYHEYEAAVDDMLVNTNTPYAPWTIVPSTDMNFKTYLVYRTIIERLEEALGVEATDWQDLESLEAAADKKHKQKKAKKQTKGKAKNKIKEEEALIEKAKETELPAEERGYVEGIDPDYPSFDGTGVSTLDEGREAKTAPLDGTKSAEQEKGTVPNA